MPLRDRSGQRWQPSGKPYVVAATKACSRFFGTCRSLSVSVDPPPLAMFPSPAGLHPVDGITMSPDYPTSRNSSSTWFVNSRHLPSSHPFRHSQPFVHGLHHLPTHPATNSRTGLGDSTSDSGYPQRSTLLPRTSYYLWDDAHFEQ